MPSSRQCHHRHQCHHRCHISRRNGNVINSRMHGNGATVNLKMRICMCQRAHYRIVYPVSMRKWYTLYTSPRPLLFIFFLNFIIILKKLCTYVEYAKTSSGSSPHLFILTSRHEMHGPRSRSQHGFSFPIFTISFSFQSKTFVC